MEIDLSAGLEFTVALAFGRTEQSASTKLVQALGEATVIGPILVGLCKSVQISPLSANVSNILNLAIMAAYGRQLTEGEG